VCVCVCVCCAHTQTHVYYIIHMQASADERKAAEGAVKAGILCVANVLLMCC
jgi:hypothetical protein